MAIKKTKEKFKFIDLFAGIGGFHIAMHSAGGKCVFTSEWDIYSKKTYDDNFGEVPFGDITKISENEIPDHDILLGGFPCQPFSIAGVSKKKALGVNLKGRAFRSNLLFVPHKRISTAIPNALKQVA